MVNKEEVQLVDMVLRIRNKLAEATDQKLPIPDVIAEKLNEKIDTIVKTLPPDLQLVLKKDVVNQKDNSVSTIPLDPVLT